MTFISFFAFLLTLLEGHTPCDELDELRQLKAALQESFVTFQLIVAPKTVSAISWNVNIHTVTLEQLRKRICNQDDDTFPLFEFKRRDNSTCIPGNDEDLRNLVRVLLVADETRVNVTKISPAKAFSSYTLSQVWTLYGLAEQYNLPAGTKADLGYFPSFECNRKPISNNAISTHLMEGIQTDLLLTPLFPANEAVKSSYVRAFLVAALRGFIVESRPKFTLKPQRDIQGRYGQGPVDYAIETCSGGVVGVTEVKREDIKQGVAQNAVQIESALSRRKRKVEEIENDEDPDPCFGIVSDAETWLFLRCTRDENNNPIFSLSSPYRVSYEEGRRQEDVTKVVEIITWLLTEVEDMMERKKSSERKRIKLGTSNSC